MKVVGLVPLSRSLRGHIYDLYLLYVSMLYLRIYMVTVLQDMYLMIIILVMEEQCQGVDVITNIEHWAVEGHL